MKILTKRCECGVLWKLQKVKTPFGVRDNDSIACSCGRELISWNGGHMYQAEIIAEGEKERAK